MSIGKIELSVGAVKYVDTNEMITEEEYNYIKNKTPELDERVGVIEDEIEEINSSLDNIKNKTPISVLEFGAIGDGVTDDTEAIRKALYYSHIHGNPIIIPNGVKCLVTETLNYYNNEYYDIILNIEGCLPYGHDQYSLNQHGGIVVKTPISLFKNKRIKGEITKLSFIGIRNDLCYFFDNCHLGGLNFKGCTVVNWGAFLYNTGMSSMTRIDNNRFMSVFYFHKAGETATSMVDSVISNNYINGGEEPTDNACFEFQDGNGSTINNNFIDYYKSIYRPKFKSAVQFPTSVGNQYQVFLYLVDVTKNGTNFFSFSSNGDTFNWNDESRLAKLKTYVKNTYVGKDGATYEIPPYIALATKLSTFKIKNGYIQSYLSNICYVEECNNAYQIGEFEVDFVGTTKLRQNSISFKKGDNKPYYVVGDYPKNTFELWFIEKVDTLPNVIYGWTCYPIGHKVLCNNQVYKLINKYNASENKWETKWLEID